MFKLSMHMEANKATHIVKVWENSNCVREGGREGGREGEREGGREKKQLKAEEPIFQNTHPPSLPLTAGASTLAT